MKVTITVEFDLELKSVTSPASVERALLRMVDSWEDGRYDLLSETIVSASRRLIFQTLPLINPRGYSGVNWLQHTEAPTGAALTVKVSE